MLEEADDRYELMSQRRTIKLWKESYIPMRAKRIERDMMNEISSEKQYNKWIVRIHLRDWQRRVVEAVEKKKSDHRKEILRSKLKVHY
jgi:hypothetical protein